jgi:hypothetical protein
MTDASEFFCLVTPIGLMDRLFIELGILHVLHNQMMSYCSAVCTQKKRHDKRKRRKLTCVLNLEASPYRYS